MPIAGGIRNTSSYHYEGLRIENGPDGITLVTIVGRGPMNSVDNEIHRALNSIWKDLDDDPRVSVVVITGEGNVFSAGGDLTEWGDSLGDPIEAMHTFKLTVELVANLVEFSKPVISAINGAAVGVALALALLADISIVSEHARLGDGHSRIGLPAGDHAAIVWPLLCGMTQSKYYLLTGDLIDGREAARIGLVTRCVADGEVLAEAMSIAGRLASSPKSVLFSTKRALNQWLREANSWFEFSAVSEALGMFGPEAREGLASFMEKRRPRFVEGEGSVGAS
jgi:enoyl-CoA hydratase/carnithine racemase